MTNILNKLQGAKTYLTAIAAICTAAVAYLNHAITGQQAIAAIFLAIQTMNIRHAIATSTPGKSS